MYSRTLIFILLFISSHTFAQREKKIDSLKTRLSNSKMDLDKFDVLNHLWNETINNNIDDALSYSKEMIELGKTLKIDTIIGYGLERKAVTYSYLNKFDSSYVYFNDALKIYNKRNDYKKIADIERNIGQDYNMIGQLDSAYYYYELAGNNYKKVNDEEGIANILNSKAIVYLMKGYNNLSIENAIKAEKIYEDKNLLMELNQNRLVIASTYGQMKDTVNAIKYHKKILAFFKDQKQQRQYASTLNLILGLQIPNKEKREENELLLKEFTEISNSLKDESLIDDALQQKAQLLVNSNKLQSAKSIYEALIIKSNKANDKYSLAHLNKSLGDLLIKLKDYKGAIQNLEASNKLAEETKLNALKPEVYKLLSKAYEFQGDFRNSLSNFKLYKSFRDTVSNTETNNRFSELKTIYETEKKEAEIALQDEEIKTLNAQAKNDRLTKTLYSIGMFSFLAIAGLLYFGFKQRMKKNKIEREKQEAIYKQEIEFKKKELASQTLHLVQKSTFIQELKENLEKIKKSPELFKVEFRRLVMLLKKQSAEDKDWEVFKSYFSEVHNDFDKALKSVYSEITEKEIRLASFLRMNLTTKEIASMLNVLPDSVLKSKYRLKKKLGLDKEQDLSTYLCTL